VYIAQTVALLPSGAAIGGWASLFLQGARDLDGGADRRIARVAGLRRSRATTRTTSGATTRATSGATTPLPGSPRSPVLVSVGPGARIRPRPGLDMSRRTLPDEEVVMVGDVPCVVAPRSLVELMGRQPAEEGLVSIDAFLRAGCGTAEDVLAYLDAHPGVIGRTRIRRLVSLSDGRARSCPESRLRWIWVVEAGLPVPHVNVSVNDDQGRLLGIPDLLDEASGLVGEYDGAQHRELRAHTDDNVREEGFERHNLQVTRATSIDIFRRRKQLVLRRRDARRDGLARDRSRDRWALAS
jgi:hypothetical protein